MIEQTKNAILFFLLFFRSKRSENPVYLDHIPEIYKDIRCHPRFSVSPLDYSSMADVASRNRKVNEVNVTEDGNQDTDMQNRYIQVQSNHHNDTYTFSVASSGNEPKMVIKKLLLVFCKY